MRFKKTLLATTIAASTIALSAAAFAANGNNINPINPSNPTNNPTNNNAATVKAIGKLSAEIRALANEVRAISMASVKTMNDALHQINKNLPVLQTVNGQNSNFNTYVHQQTMHKTTGNLKYTLQQFPDETLTYSYPTNDVQKVAENIKKRANLSNNLATLPASDTLYSDVQNIQASAEMNGENVTKPKKLYNNYFDFSTLFSPTAYNSNQQTGANYYIDYLTKRYQTLLSGINVDQLKSTLEQYKNKPTVLAQKLSAFKQSSAYKNYLLTVRSMLASKSVALSNLNHLIVERTPIETPADKANSQENKALAKLSEAIGVKPRKEVITDPSDPSKKKTVYAYLSPLQLANYIANHRVDSPDWYNKIATASPATVQRQSLYVLAEIESQMQQAHIDRERLLATLTALQLQSSNSSSMLLRTQAQNVNAAISSIGGSDNSNNSDNKDNSSTPQFTKNNGTGAAANKYKNYQKKQDSKKKNK